MAYDSENDSLNIDKLFDIFTQNIIDETHDELSENQYNKLTDYLNRINSILVLTIQC